MSNDLKNKKKSWLIEEIESLQIENERLQDVWEACRIQISDLKREVESFLLTPEVKADTEAAFKRGFQRAKRNLEHWLSTGIKELQADLAYAQDHEDGTK